MPYDDNPPFHDPELKIFPVFAHDSNIAEVAEETIPPAPTP